MRLLSAVLVVAVAVPAHADKLAVPPGADKLPPRVEIRRPVKVWIPWAAAASGVAVALGGVGVRALGDDTKNEYESRFAIECASGCAPGGPPQLAQLRDRAALESHIGTGMLVGGLAVAIVSLVWAAEFNQPYLAQVQIAAGTRGAAAVASFRF